ncbi:hypothetical protein VZT92_018772 [Zoarces viviparus]|uniref:Uncharacterized protein n=1 Tax=Zoarces viviparus TaxID=48416 RepID=A0AAW1EJ72_ZOAVI
MEEHHAKAASAKRSSTDERALNRGEKSAADGGAERCADDLKSAKQPCVCCPQKMDSKHMVQELGPLFA